MVESEAGEGYSPTHVDGQPESWYTLPAQSPQNVTGKPVVRVLHDGKEQGVLTIDENIVRAELFLEVT